MNNSGREAYPPLVPNARSPKEFRAGACVSRCALANFRHGRCCCGPGAARVHSLEPVREGHELRTGCPLGHSPPRLSLPPDRRPTSSLSLSLSFFFFVLFFLYYASERRNFVPSLSPPALTGPSEPRKLASPRAATRPLAGPFSSSSLSSSFLLPAPSSPAAVTGFTME